jgi:hypothetical protein
MYVPNQFRYYIYIYTFLYTHIIPLYHFRHDITEILFKMALSTTNLTKLALCVIHLNCEIPVPTDNIVKERLIFWFGYWIFLEYITFLLLQSFPQKKNSVDFIFKNWKHYFVDLLACKSVDQSTFCMKRAKTTKNAFNSYNYI